MAFPTLQTLGEDKFRTVVETLLAGTHKSSVAQLIQKHGINGVAVAPSTTQR